MKKVIIVAVALVLSLSANAKKESFDAMFDRVIGVACSQAEMMYNSLAPGEYPRSIDKNGNFWKVDYKWWCSGFFPGTLWQLGKVTGKQEYLVWADKVTWPLDTLKITSRDHDIGFQVNCSFGNGYEVTGNPAYKDEIVAAARHLTKRFSPVVGCTRSWNGKNFRVIIDNMMNLELLMKAAEFSGDKRLSDIAVSHANTTMANHFRDDWSSFHVVEYNEKTGAVVKKRTAQGNADDSAWARGQAWGLYGYTMMYRFTKDPKYLEVANNIAGFILPRLPKDFVPFWDYNAPDIPNDVRDASAAAIQASALIELSGYVDRKLAKKYLKVAEGTLRELSTPEYLAEPGSNCGFILKHSTGSKPGNSEVDVPLSYADYYYLEALIRMKASKK